MFNLENSMKFPEWEKKFLESHGHKIDLLDPDNIQLFNEQLQDQIK